MDHILDFEEVALVVLKHMDDEEIYKNLNEREITRFFFQIIFCRYSPDPYLVFEEVR